MPLYVIFLLGFSSPFWMKRLQVDKHRGYYNKVDKVDVSIGLWRVCEGSDFSNIMDCTSLPDSTS
ncbi:Keratinocyte-associated protein 2, partial [Biomphalaria glabrata]